MLFRKLVILGVIGALLLGSGSAVNAVADSTPISNPELPTTNVIYLPLVDSNGPPSTYGVETLGAIQNSSMVPLAAAGGTWTRYPVLEWDAIEPNLTNPRTYLWNTVNHGNEAELASASANGVNVIATVKFTPFWAQKYQGIYCGPVASNHLNDFAQFMAAAVARYSVPPYNIKYWEIGNEPDVDYTSVPANSIFGCWGDKTKPTTFGGDYYAQMLKVVTPAIRAVDPNAKVIVGGLLLDCDPTQPPPNKNCDSGNFLAGILGNGGAPYFDYVAFHGYAYYAPIPSLAQPSIIDDNAPSWAHRGGTVVGKLDFLRSVMSQYGVSKPIILDEAALSCPEFYPALCSSPTPQFYQDQADYLVKLYVRNMSLDVASTIWFTLEGGVYEWRKSGLFFDTNTTPKPAYNALDFLTQELNGAAYSGTVTQYPGVWGYEFKEYGKRIWVLGATGSVGSTITLPAGWQTVYDKYGAVVVPNVDQVFVQSPLYVEIIP